MSEEVKRPTTRLRRLEQLQESVWRLGSRVLVGGQKAQIIGMIEEWERQNPGQIRVADIRLPDFASIAGGISDRRAKEASGLLGSLTSATQAADQALLLAERGIFLAQRLAFLVRTQARLAVQEAVQDVFPMVTTQAESLIDQSGKLEPLLASTTSVLTQGRDLRIAPARRRAPWKRTTGRSFKRESLATTQPFAFVSSL